MDNLQTRIKNTRINRGLSQAVLAEKTGVSQPTVANWENGSHTPRHNVLIKIGEALSVEPIWLLSGGFTENETPAQNYMRRPIQHLPVYSWPVADQEIDIGPGRGYLPFSSHNANLVGALRLRPDDEGYEVIVLAPDDSPVDKTGRYLIARNKAVILVPSTDINADDKVYGRMAARLSYYQ